jgi:hypothetical protein
MALLYLCIGVRRSITIVAVIIAAMGIAWLTWPRPDLYIQVSLGGAARIIGLFGARSLPDTIYVKASGPVTVRIENQDTITHRLGIFGVARSHSNDFTIAQPGVYSGYCTAHPGRRLTYIVR